MVGMCSLLMVALSSLDPSPMRARAQVSAFSLSAMFGMCSLFLVAAALCQRRLCALVHSPDKDSELADSNASLLAQPGAIAGTNPPSKKTALDNL